MHVSSRKGNLRHTGLMHGMQIHDALLNMNYRGGRESVSSKKKATRRRGTGKRETNGSSCPRRRVSVSPPRNYPSSARKWSSSGGSGDENSKLLPVRGCVKASCAECRK